MRTRAFALSEGKMNVVSERLNWRASACWVASSMPCASSTTASGLPVRRPSRVKTLTMRNAYSFMGSSSRRGRGSGTAREPCEQLVVHAAEAAVGHDQHVVAGLERAGELLDERREVVVDRRARA